MANQFYVYRTAILVSIVNITEADFKTFIVIKG